MESPNKPISDADIKAIEVEVSKKQAEALKASSDVLARDIEDKVRREMETKQELERIKSEAIKREEDMSKRFKEQEDKLRAQQESFEKKLQELEAQRKGVATNQSPFTQSPNPNIKNVNGTEVDTSQLNHTEIERQSAEAFKRHFNLPHFFFEKTGEVKR